MTKYVHTIIQIKVMFTLQINSVPIWSWEANTACSVCHVFPLQTTKHNIFIDSC